MSRTRSRRGPALAAGAVLAIALGVVAVLVLRGDEPTDPTVEAAPTTAATPSTAAPSPTVSPSASPTPAPSPSPEPTDEPATVGDEPGALAALDPLDAPRLVVEHAGGVWARIGDAPWRLLGPVGEVSVIADGRWQYAWQADDPVLRSVDDPEVTCQPPAGFLDPDRYWMAIHEDGLTTVFVAPHDGGEVESVVCEDPSRPTPLTDWEPPRDGVDGQFGPIVLYDDGVRLVLEGDAEGNVTVYDSSGENLLIDYAISGPYVDRARGLLVHVDIDGGMHFAGGTLVVSDLGGNELRRTDLGGTSTLVGLVDGHAVVQRVDLPDFLPTHHVVVDLTTGAIVADEPATTHVVYVGD